MIIEKMIKRSKRVKDNGVFKRDQNFFKKILEKVNDHRGNSPQMERFLEFFGGIWEKVQEHGTPWKYHGFK